jgi:gamma-glutamylcyclotransferase (GGCT)/AIG2-like uncharacterized protein YtfP
VPRVFVYGSLRRGQANHALLQGAACAGTALTLPRYTLVDLGPYPALLEGGTTAVEGELYDVTQETLALLDQLEEHPDVYRRGPVALSGGQAAEAYFLQPQRRQGAPAIPAGRWPPPSTDKERS